MPHTHGGTLAIGVCSVDCCEPCVVLLKNLSACFVILYNLQ